MGKTEILEELPKLTKMERQEICLRLAELDSDDWLDDEEPLTVNEKALLRRASPPPPRIRTLVPHGEEVERRIQARLY